MKLKTWWKLLLSFFLLSAIPAPAQPKLVITIVVDQMRSDHFSRFAGVYAGGFARLQTEGAIFTNAQHDHAYTVTAAGHATIATGCYPSRSGIVGNSWFDQDEARKVYCVEDSTAGILGAAGHAVRNGRSPKRLLVPALAGWLKKKYPSGKVFGIARKDRAAILSTGHRADGAYWYSADSGRFVTSKYYLETYPDWVNRFNTSGKINRYAALQWEKLLPEEVYFLAREDDFAAEADGRHTRFPHVLNPNPGRPGPEYHRRLLNSPFIEQLVFDFARDLIENEQLGADDVPDFLFVGCSAADAIGHAFGPLSQESMDYFLRLDGYLGAFLDDLDAKIGHDNYLLVLSSDHGVMPLPEELARRGFAAKRFSTRDFYRDINAAFEAARSELHLPDSPFAGFSGAALLLNYSMADSAGLARETLDRVLIEKLKMLDAVEDVFTRSDLAGSGENNRPFLIRFRHSNYPRRSGDLTLRFKPFYLVRSANYGTTHGSPYAYDTHVPIIFAGPGIKPGKYNQAVRTVDIAPTLADILHLPPGHQFDGASLLKLMQK